MSKNIQKRLAQLENRGANRDEYIQVLMDEFRLNFTSAKAVYFDWLGV
jgi:hypothetical protein